MIGTRISIDILIVIDLNEISQIDNRFVIRAPPEPPSPDQRRANSATFPSRAVGLTVARNHVMARETDRTPSCDAGRGFVPQFNHLLEP